MGRFMLWIGLLGIPLSALVAQDSPVLRQSYNAKFGYYHPDPSISNGLAVGVDGMTEFVRLDLFGSIGADLYLKQAFNPFQGPSPTIERQSLILIPITISGGYKFADLQDAETRLYIGAGAGYSLYFYDLTYSSSGGGLLGSPLSSQSHSKSSGMFTVSAQLRVVVGRIFLEPKLYFARAEQVSVQGGFVYKIDPSGFIVTLGYSTK